MNIPLLPNIQSPKDLKKIDPKELPKLAQEIRTHILEQVSKSGGHLTPNLGVVELTIALHYVFDFDYDRLLFDVGHQCYPHKLLTGRLPLFSKLRQREGMAGFPEPTESSYDLFSVGHAGTSISTGVGMARGDNLNKQGFHSKKCINGRRVVSLIGDASIVNGVAMEGLNDAGTLNRQFLIVLNDNGMSIAKPQGAISAYFDRLRMNTNYTNIKSKIKEILKQMPGGDSLRGLSHRMTEIAKDAIGNESLFEHFGILTIGPVDGHNLNLLIETLTEIRNIDKPILLHAHTIKGKGFNFSESNSTRFHSPKPFKIKGSKVDMIQGEKSFTSAFSNALCDIMEKDTSIVTATAAMPDGTGLDQIIKKFPNRSFDCGICESHTMDMLAGMAKSGLKPFFAVYSTFLQRAFDQTFQEVSLQNLPVRLCLDRAGLVGGDGSVHHGFCDISLLRTLPNSVLMAPIDEPSLKEALKFMTNIDSAPSAIRYPRDSVSLRLESAPCPPFTLGKARPLHNCKKPAAAIIGYGSLAIEALEAIDLLATTLPVEVWDARFAKPIDEHLLRSLLERNIPVITVEDHGLQGGFGSAVLESCNKMKLDTRLIYRLGIPDKFIPYGSRNDQLEDCGLTSSQIAQFVEKIAHSPLQPSNAKLTYK